MNQMELDGVQGAVAQGPHQLQAQGSQGPLQYGLGLSGAAPVAEEERKRDYEQQRAAQLTLGQQAILQPQLLQQLSQLQQLIPQPSLAQSSLQLQQQLQLQLQQQSVQLQALQLQMQSTPAAQQQQIPQQHRRCSKPSLKSKKNRRFKNPAAV